MIIKFNFFAIEYFNNCFSLVSPDTWSFQWFGFCEVLWNILKFGFRSDSIRTFYIPWYTYSYSFRCLHLFQNHMTVKEFEQTFLKCWCISNQTYFDQSTVKKMFIFSPKIQCLYMKLQFAVHVSFMTVIIALMNTNVSAFFFFAINAQGMSFHPYCDIQSQIILASFIQTTGEAVMG